VAVSGHEGEERAQRLRVQWRVGAVAVRSAFGVRKDPGRLVVPDKSRMQVGGLPLEWWSAGAIVSARLGEGYAFMATALGTIRHRGVQTPPPDTIEGLLYALPEDRYVVDARRLAALLGDATPAPRVSPWFGYSPLDPAHMASNDGIVFVKDAPAGQTWWPVA
jgi:hypothetical protein